MLNDAIFSQDRTHRYVLYRWWRPGRPYLIFIGLNPSNGDELRNDPTIRKIRGFAAQWDYGQMCVLNLFSFISTNPLKKFLMDDKENIYLINHLQPNPDCKLVLAGWGNEGRKYPDRIFQIMSYLALQNRQVYCLGRTKSGQPRHPLYVPYSRTPEIWEMPPSEEK